MADLGSAAVGTAGALDGGGGHSTTKERRSRAASSRPSRKPGRSRSLEGEPRKPRSVDVERVVKAPIYIEPGKEPDGVKSNAERVFDYLAHVAAVVNGHADAMEAADTEGEILRSRIDVQAMDIANMKSIVAQSDAEAKRILEFNDGKLKKDMAFSLQKVWDFLAMNNGGIMQLFGEADAAVTKLAKRHRGAEGGRCE